jgi:peroxiredoxin 2/4
MIIIGKKCPSFSAPAVVNNQITTITDADLQGHYTLLFFYAVDFSAVCPSEVYALQSKIEEFNKRNVTIIAISVDSIYTHMAWLRWPREKGGIQGTQFALVSDATHELSKMFGVFDYDQALSFRGTFLIDENLIVQYGSVNNMAFGRSTGEILRTIDAIQFAATHGVSCPANWQPGAQTLESPWKVAS